MRLKSRCWQGCFLLEALRGKSISLPFSAFSGCCIPWLVTPSSIFKVHHFNLCFHQQITFFSVCIKFLCLSVIRILVIIFRAHPDDNSEYSSHLKILNLITFVVFLLPYKIIFTGYIYIFIFA